MTDRLTAEQCLAKALVFEECADHLEQHWTDDKVEFRYGLQFGRKLRERARRWKLLASAREKDPFADASLRV